MYYTIHTFIILLHSRTWALNNPSYDHPAVQSGLAWTGLGDKVDNYQVINMINPAPHIQMECLLW